MGTVKSAFVAGTDVIRLSTYPSICQFTGMISATYGLFFARHLAALFACVGKVKPDNIIACLLFHPGNLVIIGGLSILFAGNN